MSRNPTHINDPFKTSGSSPPAGEEANIGAIKKSQAEIRADQEFKSACKAMADARQRRDTLKKRREERELRERLEALVAENTRLKERIEDYQSARSDLLDQVRGLEAELIEARSDAEKLLEDQKEIVWKANKVLARRDDTISGLRTILEIVENAISAAPAENEDDQDAA